MKMYPLGLSKIPRLVIPMMVLVLIVACGSPTMLTTINLRDAEINQTLNKTPYIASPEGWAFKVQSAEIKDGFIRVYGDYTPRAIPTVSGSLDIALVVQDGQLKGEAKGMDFQDMTIPDAPIRQIANLLTQSLVQTVSDGKKEPKFESVEITEGLLKITLRFLP